MLDSTVFTHGHSVNVRFWAKDNYGREYDQSGAAPVKNMGACFNHPEFTYLPGGLGAVEADQRLNNMGYLTSVHTEAWTGSAFLNAFQCPVVYENTHGDSLQLLPGDQSSESDLNEPKIWGQANGDEPSVLFSRWLNNGSGSPPYNSSSLPPVNLFIMDSCNGLDDPVHFDSSMVPYSNFYVPYPENCSVHGYTVSVLAISSQATAGALLEFLAMELPLVHASALIRSSAAEWNIFCNDGGIRIMNQPSDYAYSGDPWTKLKGVYFGYDTMVADVPWWRPL